MVWIFSWFQHHHPHQTALAWVAYFCLWDILHVLLACSVFFSDNCPLLHLETFQKWKHPLGPFSCWNNLLQYDPSLCIWSTACCHCLHYPAYPPVLHLLCHSFLLPCVCCNQLTCAPRFCCSIYNCPWISTNSVLPSPFLLPLVYNTLFPSDSLGCSMSLNFAPQYSSRHISPSKVLFFTGLILNAHI